MNKYIDASEQELKIIERLRLEAKNEEYKYLHLLSDIMDDGIQKSDRTGVGTKSIFGTQLKFNIENSIPVMTTKKVAWKSIIEELLWFLRGDTNSKNLEKLGVNIWKGNTSTEFLEKMNLPYDEGDAGPIYGFQWRKWGAPYSSGPIALPAGVGIDQIANVIDTIKKNPNDRRIIVSAWNVEDIDQMALPPCHLLHQYYVENGKLHLQWYQRSVDSFLGLSFNITSYAVLNYLISRVCGLKPGSITFCGGDTHIYLNHMDQCKEQISRVPYDFPKLKINKELKSIEDIEKLTFNDFELLNYKSHAAIKAPMAV